MHQYRISTTLWLYALSCILLPTKQASAWGEKGHRMVAIIAEQRLTPKAKAAVTAILGTADMASIAIWADDVKFTTHKDTYNWHFVDIPKGIANYSAARDCKASPQGDCGIAAIAHVTAILKSKTASDSAKADAMRFLIHLVGDIHQPFHCTENHGDLGGNKVNVSLCGVAEHKAYSGGTEPYNLHEVWDNEVINSAKLSETQYVASLNKWLKTQDEKKLGLGTTTAWVEATHHIPETNGFYVVSKTDICAPYMAKALPVVNAQLATAGVRLAALLNAIYR